MSPPENANRPPGGYSGQAAAECRDSGNGKRQDKRSPRTKQLSPLEIAALFAPVGTVPALVRHEGRLVVHPCPIEAALDFQTDGSA